MWDLISLTRGQTHAPCSGSAESQLDRQRSSQFLILMNSNSSIFFLGCLNFWCHVCETVTRKLHFPLGGYLTKDNTKSKSWRRKDLLLAASKENTRVTSQSRVSLTSKIEDDLS